MTIVHRFANLIPRTAYHLAIDVAHCNLTCSMCPRGGINGSGNPDRGLMEFDLFRRIVEKFVRDKVWIDGMSAGHWGEPLLNPDLPAMIRYVKSHPTAMKPGTRVSVNTTLNRLPDPVELMKSGIDSIAISISGMTQEVYCRNHKGGNADTVLENIVRLAEIRKGEQLEHVKLRMVFHGYLYNRPDAELAKEFCAQHGLRFTLHRPAIVNVEDAVAFFRDKERQRDFYGAFIDVDEEMAGMRTMDYGRIKDCHLRRKRVTVNLNGQLYRCAQVFEKKHYMGSIFDFNIRDIPATDSDICRTCADTPISWR
jgi:MoaA/NifB/PqqE/SkfB family radical SAM enzyme